MSYEVRTKWMAEHSMPVKVEKEDFHKYLRVQYEGQFNMLSREAEEAVGIEQRKYYTIINFYKQLKELHGDLDE